jgi:alpha-tubulin suppressor-like RCC1 family protein
MGAGVALASAPVSISKQFGADSVLLGAPTSLSFTIGNDNPPGHLPVAGIGFTDALPDGLVVATPNGLTDDCGGAVADPGSQTVSLSGVTLPSNTVCDVSLNVTTTSPGLKDNTVTVTSDSGTGNTSQAFLDVQALPPTVTEQFGSSSLPTGASTSLTFTLTNPNASTKLSGITFGDELPGGLVIATPNGLDGSCDRGITAAAGSRAVSVTDETLAPSASCTFSVQVMATGAGDQLDIACPARANESGNSAAPSPSASLDVTGHALPGQLYALGENRSGQLGDAPFTSCDPPGPTPTRVSLPGATGPPIQVATGEAYSLALTPTGQLYSFGANFYGQLGRPPNDPNDPNPTPVALSGATGPVTAIAAGGAHSLALTSTGQLYAFGDDQKGQLGSADTNTNPHATPTPVGVPGATGPVARVAAGAEHSLAVTSTGQLYAFGDNHYGELGNTTNNNTDNPNPTPELVTLPGATGPVAKVAAGGAHSLALTTTGQLYAFGDNYYGELGNATNTHTSDPNPTPQLVTLPGATGPVAQIAAGDAHSLALTTTGELYAFGDNYNGELGNNTNNNTSTANPTPQLVTLPGASDRIVQVRAGEGDSFALTATGKLYAFGNNASGQLGPATNAGTFDPDPTPTRVDLPPGTTVEAISTGPAATHTLIVVSDLSVQNPFAPIGRVGVRYDAALHATGGLAPYTWSASGLGRGLAIAGQTGVLSGVPTVAGTFAPSITAADANGILAGNSLTLRIAPAAVLRAARVKGSIITLTLSCPGAGPACPGRAVITARERKRGGRILAVNARRTRKPTTATVVIGQRALSIPAGATITVPIALNPTGRRLRAHFRGLQATLAVTITGATTRRTIAFRKRGHR